MNSTPRDRRNDGECDEKKKSESKKKFFLGFIIFFGRSSVKVKRNHYVFYCQRNSKPKRHNVRQNTHHKKEKKIGTIINSSTPPEKSTMRFINRFHFIHLIAVFWHFLRALSLSTSHFFADVSTFRSFYWFESAKKLILLVIVRCLIFFVVFYFFAAVLFCFALCSMYLPAMTINFNVLLVYVGLNPAYTLSRCNHTRVFGFFFPTKRIYKYSVDFFFRSLSCWFLSVMLILHLCVIYS